MTHEDALKIIDALAVIRFCVIFCTIYFTINKFVDNILRNSRKNEHTLCQRTATLERQQRASVRGC